MEDDEVEDVYPTGPESIADSKYGQRHVLRIHVSRCGTIIEADLKKERLLSGATSNFGSCGVATYMARKTAVPNIAGKRFSFKPNNAIVCRAEV